jgi:tetratricopeptide (TPR) repeat protein
VEIVLLVLLCSYQGNGFLLGKQVDVGQGYYSNRWALVASATLLLFSFQFSMSWAKSIPQTKNKTSKSTAQIVKKSKIVDSMSTSKSTQNDAEKINSNANLPTIRNEKNTEKIDLSAQNEKIQPASSDKLWAVMRNDRGEPIYLMPHQEQQIVRPIGPMPSSSGAVNTLFQAGAVDIPEHKNPEQSEQWNRFIETACTAHNSGDYKKAKSSLQSALPLTDDELEQATLHAAIGEIDWETDKKKDAVDSYQKASKLVPEQFELRYVQLLVLNGQRQEAITTLETATDNDIPRSQQTFLLGTLYEEMGDYSQALKYLNEAAVLMPNSVDVHYNLGLACELSGQNEKAHNEYETALKIQPSDEDLKKAVLRTKKQ